MGTESEIKTALDVDMFQNGLSSSPSNTPSPFNGPNFPLISIDFVGIPMVFNGLQLLSLSGVGVGVHVNQVPSSTAES